MSESFIVTVTLAMLAIAVFVSLPLSFWFRGRSSTTRVRRRMSREQLENEMRREYGDRFQPLTPGQAERFAQVDAEKRAREGGQAAEDANYDRHIRDAVLFNSFDPSPTYISAAGHRVDAESNTIIEYNVNPPRK